METHVEGFRYRLLPKSLLSNFCFTITAIILTTQFQDHVVFAGNIAEIKLWLTCVGIGPTTSWKLHSSALPSELQGQGMISASFLNECLKADKKKASNLANVYANGTCILVKLTIWGQQCRNSVANIIVYYEQIRNMRHLKILQFVSYFKVLL